MKKEKIFENVPLDGMVYGKLLALTNLMLTLGDEFFQEITLKQHFVLIAIQLFKDSPPSLKEVAEVAGCSYQNVKKMAILLEKKGYLSILCDKNDKRKLKLIIKDKFHKKSVALESRTKEFWAALFKDLSDKQIKTMLSVLIQMEKNLTEYKERL